MRFRFAFASLLAFERYVHVVMTLSLYAATLAIKKTSLRKKKWHFY